MAQILVRDLDPKVVSRLKKRARTGGRSLQSEVKAILEQAARVDTATARALAKRIRKGFTGRRMARSTDLIREDRQK